MLARRLDLEELAFLGMPALELTFALSLGFEV